MADTVSDTFRSMLLHALRNGIVRVVFTKRDGTERTMLCTLMESVLPERSGESEREKNDSIQCVWDTEANGWRSFRWDSIVSFDGATAQEVVNAN